MKKILVPCDFSKPAVNAFQFALTIAKKLKAEIQLLFVIEWPDLRDPMFTQASGYDRSMNRNLEENAIKKFSSLIGKYGNNEQKVTSCVQFGPTLDTILRMIVMHKYELVVMGSHGAPGIKEFVLGSNAESIVRNSPIPVLVVKTYNDKPVENIVFPCAFPIQTSADFILKVKRLQNFFDARIHFVWINTPSRFVSDDASLNRMKNFVRKSKFRNYTIQTFSDLSEKEGILHFSRMISADMIVMATHGRKGIAHLLHGSVTEDVVNHAPNLIWTYALRMTKSRGKKNTKKELRQNRDSVPMQA